MFGSLSQPPAVFTASSLSPSLLSLSLSLSLWHNIFFERQDKKAYRKSVAVGKEEIRRGRQRARACVWSKTSTDRMILNPTSIPPLPKPRVRLRCRDIPPPKRNFSISFSLASENNTATTTNQIRTQLDQLHSEADQTRTKANSARSRLMRLTEAAENLRRRAAVEVGVGREDDARELLLQKKKVMQALEKSKKRVELLDELSAKLIEAISVKETQLIGNVALDLEISKEDTSHPIRIVSPKEDIAEHSKEAEVFEPDGLKSCQGQERESQEDFQENVYADYLQKNGEGAASDVTFSGNKRTHLLSSISSFEDFLESLDQQFQEIEVELLTIFRLSTLVMESDEKQKSPKVRQTAEILKDVRGIRARIANIMQTKTNDG